jgi:ABC-type branched-subunit amino acid transport system permease subunit
VSSLGLVVAGPLLIDLWFDQVVAFDPPSLAWEQGRIYHLGDYTITAEQLLTVLATVAVVILLGVLFRFTAIGLRMRAVVESPRMLELAGVDADRVSSFSWMLSSLFAALAGLLLAPLFFALDAISFTILIVAAIAAAAFGRLSSIPLTFAGGILLGIGEAVLGGELPPSSTLAANIRPTLPFIVLVLLLLFWPGLRHRRAATDPLASVDPPPPAPAVTYKDDAMQRFTRIAFPVFIAAVFALVFFVLSGLWVARFTEGIVYATIFLSITVMTGLSGQVSLAQAAFAGVGAFTTANLAVEQGMPVLLAMCVGGLVAAGVGALVAIPALRLEGIYLTLATLAFALLFEKLVLPQESFTHSSDPLAVPRPLVGSVEVTGDRGFFVLAFAVFALVAFAVILVRNGATGRFLTALRGSETAAQAIGIDPRRARIVVFAFSAAIAGIGGGLLAIYDGRAVTSDFVAFQGLVWTAIVVSIGVRGVDAGAIAGISFVVLPVVLNDMLHVAPSYAIILFGVGAVLYARHPEGTLDAQTRASIQRIQRLRARRDRSRTPADPGSVNAEATT